MDGSNEENKYICRVHVSLWREPLASREYSNQFGLCVLSRGEGVSTAPQTWQWIPRSIRFVPFHPPPPFPVYWNVLNSWTDWQNLIQIAGCELELCSKGCANLLWGNPCLLGLKTNRYPWVHQRNRRFTTVVLESLDYQTKNRLKSLLRNISLEFHNNESNRFEDGVLISAIQLKIKNFCSVKVLYEACGCRQHIRRNYFGFSSVKGE